MNSERLRIAKRANSPTTLEPHTASVRQPNLGEAAGEPHSAKRRLANLPRRVIPRSPRLPSADAALTATSFAKTLDAFTDEDMTTSTRQQFVAIGHRAAYGSRANA